MTFHVEYNHTHHDWQCRAGVIVGVGATPEQATVACLADLARSGPDAVMWLAPPAPCNPPVIHEFVPEFRDWKATFYEAPKEGFWGHAYIGYGETPELATLDLMEDVAKVNNSLAASFAS